jgi:hypothetical protein
MTRTKTLALLGVLAAQGCIIYEDRPHGWGECHDDAPCLDTGDWTGGGTTDTLEQPQIDLKLTVNEARAGEQLLSSLVSDGDREVDLASVGSVTFSRDVQVVDLMHRTDEVVLLLAVGAEADPGEIDVWVTSTGGQGWILGETFTILPEDGECTSGNGGPGSTADTACP